MPAQKSRLVTLSDAVASGGMLHPENRMELEHMLKNRFYIPALLQRYESAVVKHGLPDAVSHLKPVMRASESEVRELIEARIAAGEIRDKGQASKTVAGHGFQSLVFCALASLQANGLIPSHLRFTLKTRRLVGRGGDFIIEVGPEKIKPDIDLLVCSSRSDSAPRCIFSLKTSLRERAGQTHRWKVLLDIVTAANCRSIKDKYDLQYKGDANFKLGMITPNFYDEVDSPRRRGLFQFFDHIYMAKPGEFSPPVLPLSRIAEDLRRIYG